MVDYYAIELLPTVDCYVYGFLTQCQIRKISSQDGDLVGVLAFQLTKTLLRTRDNNKSM